MGNAQGSNSIGTGPPDGALDSTNPATPKAAEAEKNKKLRAAAEAGDDAAVEAALDGGANINAVRAVPWDDAA